MIYSMSKFRYKHLIYYIFVLLNPPTGTKMIYSMSKFRYKHLIYYLFVLLNPPTGTKMIYSMSKFRYKHLIYYLFVLLNPPTGTKYVDTYSIIVHNICTYAYISHVTLYPECECIRYPCHQAGGHHWSHTDYQKQCTKLHRHQ